MCPSGTYTVSRRKPLAKAFFLSKLRAYFISKTWRKRFPRIKFSTNFLVACFPPIDAWGIAIHSSLIRHLSSFRCKSGIRLPMLVKTSRIIITVSACLSATVIYPSDAWDTFIAMFITFKWCFLQILVLACLTFRKDVVCLINQRLRLSFALIKRKNSWFL